MHLYFLLKALIMIVTMCAYVVYSHYSDVYSLIASSYGLNTGVLLVETTLEVIFFILLLISLDRRVN